MIIYEFLLLPSVVKKLETCTKRLDMTDAAKTCVPLLSVAKPTGRVMYIALIMQININHSMQNEVYE